jgi:hypothetical protein
MTVIDHLMYGEKIMKSQKMQCLLTLWTKLYKY